MLTTLSNTWIRALPLKMPDIASSSPVSANALVKKCLKSPCKKQGHEGSHC